MKPMQFVTACVSAAVLAAVAGMLYAKPGVVLTKDGRSYEGEIAESPQQVAIVRKGITTAIRREDVSSIDYSSFADRFEKRLSSLDPADVKNRMVLAHQAFDHGEYILAQKAVSQALLIDPTNDDAREMDINIGTTLQLSPGQATPNPTTKPVEAPANAATQTGPAKMAMLTDDQVDLIRKGELRSGDRVQIQFLNRVVRRYVDSDRSLNYRDFTSQPIVDQALAILDHGTPDMASDVHLRADPTALASYARAINPALVQGCATSSCHGTANAGGFQLVAQVQANAATTNFFLLSEFVGQDAPNSGSVFGGAHRLMIVRGQGAESLLANYILPAREAEAGKAHPAVKGYTGIAPTREALLYKTIVRWQNQELNAIAPNYGAMIPFDRPTTQPADLQPTTRPATQPAGDANP